MSSQLPPLGEVAMYSECASLTDTIQERVLPRIVLTSYPESVGRDVVRSVLPSLASRGSEGDENSRLQSREEVEWTMQVLGYGLQLPLSEHLLVNSCVAVYEDWLTAFSSSPSPSVPAPVLTDPNHYCLVILTHLYQLFIPREGERDTESQLDIQFAICQKVLIITKSLLMAFKKKSTLSESTCEAVCHHLLSVADLLLSPIDPFSPASSLASRLSNQLLHVLFAAWLTSCTTFFPPPHLWKTLRELCHRWRHHLCLAEQWSSLLYSLTLRVIRHLYSSSYLNHLQGHLQEDEEFSEILQSIPADSLVQCWFRMLHTLGNPVDLISAPSFSSLTHKTGSESGGDQLSLSGVGQPHIFYAAMRGVAQLVYLFLGLELQQEAPHPSSEGSASLSSLVVKPSPQVLRRKGSREYRDKNSVPGVSITGGGGGGGGGKRAMWYTETSSPRLPPLVPLTQSSLLEYTNRPRGNTLLHLIGSWLFDAASRSLTEVIVEGRKTDTRSTVSHSLVDLNASIDSALTTPPEDHAQFEAGQAEAFGALCAIFSSQPCGEPFLPLYLTRFYHCLRPGLQLNDAYLGLSMTRILLNSSSLFRKGLPGLNLLLPHFLTALEKVLPHPKPLVRCAVGEQELRHASIQILLSVFSLPLHFLHQPLPSLPDMEEGKETESDGGVTFYSFKEWMLWLLFSAIEYERDGSNMQLLLHAVLVSLQDIALYENVMAKMAEEGGGGGGGGGGGEMGSSASKRTQFFSMVDKDYGSASLFRRACKAAHWCLHTWQNNVHISLPLSALELLQGLAQLHFEYIDHADLNMAVLRICDYIHHHAEKEKIHHSKDLHTSIVAAFSCLLSWVTLHPYLLGDKSTLNAVMQVVELGISGAFSQGASGEPVYKGEKELKPISGRVKEIAEFVLSCIVEQVGAFPQPCGAESTSSLLNEEHLMARLPVSSSIKGGAGDQFQYFLVDNSILLALLETRFSDAAAPSLTAVIRGLSGRYCWNMQLHMNPRSSQYSTQWESMPRPLPSSPPLLSPSSLQRDPWPEEASKAPQLELDTSIPSLESVLNDSGREEFDKMAELVENEIQLEMSSQESLLSPPLSLDPPHSKDDSISTARLLLNHLYLLHNDTVHSLTTGQKQSIVMLDHTHSGFRSSLGGLDRLPTRFCDTVFLLYCREGCHRAEEILSQQQTTSTGRPVEYTEFLSGLGWIVDPISHSGFQGKIRSERPDDSGHLLQFGAVLAQQQFHYFADSMTEMAFVQPVLRPSASYSSASLRSVESSDSGQDSISQISKSSLPPPTLHQVMNVEREPLSSQTSLPFLHTPAQTGGGVGGGEGERFHTLPTRGGKYNSGSRSDLHSDTPRNKKTSVPQDCAVMVVWLERFEDYISFPLETLSSVLHGASLCGGSRVNQQRRILPCIFIHLLPSGLYQVTTIAPRMESLAGPLQEGMVVSRRSLARLVRLTAANMCCRHRLDNEGYCPPHVKRKRKMEEMATAFSLPTPVPEFYSNLILNCQKTPLAI